MDSHGVVHLYGLVNENGVKAFVLENGNERWVLFQDKDSTEVIGRVVSARSWLVISTNVRSVN